MDLFYRGGYFELRQEASTQGDFVKFKQILSSVPMDSIIHIFTKAFEIRAIDFIPPNNDHDYGPDWNTVLRLAAPKVVFLFNGFPDINNDVASSIRELGEYDIRFRCLKISHVYLESNGFSGFLLGFDTLRRRVADKISVLWNMDNPSTIDRGQSNAARLIEILHQACVLEIFVYQDSRSTLTRFWPTSIRSDLLSYVTASQFRLFATHPHIYTFDNCSKLIVLTHIRLLEQWITNYFRRTSTIEKAGD
ncbi:unnamed protein product [Ambrosiozyma monospora]|uniref:Unnamed protein product n=1 Tax=Ambrosiozyma monospora TaxID=43982 RepID=A0ACB5SYT3_AMBMO|nr:unnamed protein product [Ambrosiozyma monospora]